MPATPWSQPITPFRHSLQRLEHPAGDLLAQWDALEEWCRGLLAPPLPAAVTLASPFADLRAPELAAAGEAAAAPADRAATPAGAASPRRPAPAYPSPAQAAPAAHPPAEAAGPDAPSASPGKITAAGAPLAPSGTGENGARPSFALRRDRLAGIAPTTPVSGRAAAPSTPSPSAPSPSAPSPSAPSPSGSPAPRLLRPEELAPRIPAAGPTAQAADPQNWEEAWPSPASSPATPPTPGPTALEPGAGLRLLAALTASLLAQPVVNGAHRSDVPKTAAQSAPPAAVPWRTGDTPGLLVAPPAAAPDAVRGPGSVQTPTPSTPQPLAPPAMQPAAALPFWPPTGQVGSVALDPDLLADLVNEALREQARRHGANLP